MHFFVNVKFCWVVVWIFLSEKDHFEEWVVLDEVFDFRGFVITCMVNKKNDAFELVFFCVTYKVAEVFSELDVSSFFEAVPDDFFVGPEHCDKKVSSFCVS